DKTKWSPFQWPVPNLIMKGQRQNRIFPHLNLSPIDECGTLDYRIIQFRATRLEILYMIQLQNHNFSCLSLNNSINHFRVVQVGHAVDQIIHVSTIISQETESLRKNTMK